MNDVTEWESISSSRKRRLGDSASDADHVTGETWKNKLCARWCKQALLGTQGGENPEPSAALSQDMRVPVFDMRQFLDPKIEFRFIDSRATQSC